MKFKIQNSKFKILFMGTPGFGAIILERLCQSEYKPVLVITAPDKPVGRKQILTPSSVKIIAQKHNIPIEQPEKIENCKLKIENLRPDLIVLAAYGQILPQEVLDIPKYGSLNVHPSLLPKYRGASPIQSAILNGEEETGVTIILMDAQIDHGPVISNIKYQISNIKITYEELLKELANLGGKLLIKTIPKWLKGEIKPMPQDEKEATYTKILKKEDGKIDWQKSAEYIERQIRAFNPWPTSFCKFKIANSELKILKIWKASVLKQTKAGPKGSAGKTFLAPGNKIAIQTAKDYLIIEELQEEGKRKMTTKEFLRGHPDFIGTMLE